MACVRSAQKDISKSGLKIVKVFRNKSNLDTFVWEKDTMFQFQEYTNRSSLFPSSFQDKMMGFIQTQSVTGCWHFIRFQDLFFNLFFVVDMNGNTKHVESPIA